MENGKWTVENHMFIFLYILLFLSVLLEGTVTTLPLVLVCLLCLTILKREASVFLFAFFSGIMLDIFTLRPVGGASIFFLMFVLLILLYQRKYEIYSFPFVMTASFLGSLLFLGIFSYDYIILQAAMSIILGTVVFAIVKVLGNNTMENQEVRSKKYLIL
jgi:hypothetical protein